MCDYTCPGRRARGAGSKGTGRSLEGSMASCFALALAATLATVLQYHLRPLSSGLGYNAQNKQGHIYEAA